MTLPRLEFLFKSTSIVNQTIETLEATENIEAALYEVAAQNKDPLYANVVARIKSVLNATLNEHGNFIRAIFNLQIEFPKAKQLVVRTGESQQEKDARAQDLEKEDFEEVIAFLDDATLSDSKVQKIFHCIIPYLFAGRDFDKLTKPQIRYLLDLTCRERTTEEPSELDRHAKNYQDLLGETYTFEQMVAKSPSLVGLYISGFLEPESCRTDASRILDFTNRLRPVPHLKSLKASYFHPPLSPAVVQAIGADLPRSLTHLDLCGSAIGDLTLIPALPALTSLELAALKALPQNITHLLNFQRLEKLHLSWEVCKIYDPSKPPVGHDDPKVTRELLELHKLPALQEIDFRGCSDNCLWDKPYTGPARAVLIPLTRMRKIGFRILVHMSQREQIKNVQPFVVRAYERLTDSPAPLQEDALIIKKIFPRPLYDLTLSYLGLCFDDVRSIMMTLPRDLYDLILSYLDLKELTYEEFASIPKEQSKYWLAVQLQAKRKHLSMSYMGYLTGRAGVLAAGTSEDPTEHVPMTMFKSSQEVLESLDCSDFPLTDEALKAIVANFTKLRSLNLNGCQELRKEGLEHLVALQDTLEELDIRRIPYTHIEGSIDFLALLPNLQKLYIKSIIHFRGGLIHRPTIPLNARNLALIYSLDKLTEIDVDFDQEDLSEGDRTAFRRKLATNRASSLHGFNPKLAALRKDSSLEADLLELSQNPPSKAFYDLLIKLLTTLGPRTSQL